MPSRFTVDNLFSDYRYNIHRRLDETLIKYIFSLSMSGTACLKRKRYVRCKTEDSHFSCVDRRAFRFHSRMVLKLKNDIDVQVKSYPFFSFLSSFDIVSRIIFIISLDSSERSRSKLR